MNMKGEVIAIASVGATLASIILIGGWALWSDVKADFRDIRSDIDTARDAISDNGKGLVRVEERLANQRLRLTEIADSLIAHDQDFANIKVKLESYATRIAAIERLFAALDQDGQWVVIGPPIESSGNEVDKVADTEDDTVEIRAEATAESDTGADTMSSTESVVEEDDVTSVPVVVEDMIEHVVIEGMSVPVEPSPAKEEQCASQEDCGLERQ